ncbi:MAG: hypothetical protein D6731_23420 [Planctomycetota bacterium]|nr:MAG: hypothetical protein D6731_23420 [Planctomycetota bacterium]
MLLRLDEGGPAIPVVSVERVEDRVEELLFDVRTRAGDLLTLRLARDDLRAELHTVETEHPERWSGWSERAAAPPDERSGS